MAQNEANSLAVFSPVGIYIRTYSQWMQRNGELEFNNPTCVAVSTVNSLITFVTLACTVAFNVLI